jgi:hypothetical protein
MFENISGLTDLDAGQKLKIAIVGEPKAGKTNFALTIPGTIFHMDFDTRFESVKEFVKRTGRRDITSKTYTDLNPAQPIAVSTLEADIAMFEYNKKQGKEIPANYIIDSITFLRACCEHELIKQHPGMSRTIKLGANNVKIPQGWDIVNGNKAYLEYLIGRISELGNVIAVFHEMDEKDNPASTKEEKKYTGRKTIQPQYLSSILSVFNDVFRITIDYSGKRIVQCQPSSDFMASTSMKLSKEEEPDIFKMLEKNKC